MTPQERYSRDKCNSDPALWHHVWATVVMQETFDHLVERGQLAIAALIEEHLERAQANRDHAIAEARVLNAAVLRDGRE